MQPDIEASWIEHFLLGMSVVYRLHPLCSVLSAHVHILGEPEQALNSGETYYIVGKFHWCKFSYIWSNSPQNKFLYVLISYTRATRPHS